MSCKHDMSCKPSIRVVKLPKWLREQGTSTTCEFQTCQTAHVLRGLSLPCCWPVQNKAQAVRILVCHMMALSMRTTLECHFLSVYSHKGSFRHDEIFARNSPFAITVAHLDLRYSLHSVYHSSVVRSRVPAFTKHQQNSSLWAGGINLWFPDDLCSVLRTVSHLLSLSPTRWNSRYWFWTQCFSQDEVAEQGVFTVWCVLRLGSCDVVKFSISFRRGKPTFSVALFNFYTTLEITDSDRRKYCAIAFISMSHSRILSDPQSQTD